jgi:hypothetical protein
MICADGRSIRYGPSMRTALFDLLGLLLGSGLGLGTGLGVGLLSDLYEIRCFEGACGYFVVMIELGGMSLGLPSHSSHGALQGPAPRPETCLAEPDLHAIVPYRQTDWHRPQTMRLWPLTLISYLFSRHKWVDMIRLTATTETRHERCANRFCRPRTLYLGLAQSRCISASRSKSDRN